MLALWVAARDPRTPLAAKVVAASVAAYALSPIDLIPDFIPVLGLVDDLLLVPLGIWCALKLIPPHLMREYRARAGEIAQRPTSRVAAAMVVLLWIIGAALIGWHLSHT